MIVAYGRDYGVVFQSTLPARGSDANLLPNGAAIFVFQSTLPARGSDNGYIPASLRTKRFQSTLPARGSDRYHHQYMLLQNQVFQSTLPARGSDLICRYLYILMRISIHAPREGERHHPSP